MLGGRGGGGGGGGAGGRRGDGGEVLWEGRAVEGVLLELQQSGQVGHAPHAAHWLRQGEGGGAVLNQLLPWTNERGPSCHMTITSRERIGR